MVGMRRVILAVMATALVVCLAWMGGKRTPPAPYRWIPPGAHTHRTSTVSPRAGRAARCLRGGTSWKPATTASDSPRVLVQ